MKIIKLPQDIESVVENVVLTMGKLDGIHIGHRALIDTTLSEASALGCPSGVLTFEPHPKEFFKAEKFMRLNTPEQKTELIESMGVDYLFIQDFNDEFASIRAETFVKEVLVDRLKIRKLIFGQTLSFGKGAEGNSDTMEKLADKYEFDMKLVPPVESNGELISSTLVRKRILAGQMKRTATLLGREYFIEGIVIKGAGIGKKELYPTANISTINPLIPPAGVYASRCETRSGTYNSVTFIGRKQTFNDNNLTIETHLIGKEIDLYSNNIRIHFVRKIRDEKKFATVSALKKQISADIEEAKNILQDGG